MVSTAPGSATVEASSTPLGIASLGTQERAVLSVLLDNCGRVLGRRELARQAGMSELSERRCDSVLVGIRRALGQDAIVTVRRRGWMLSPEAVGRARDTLLSGNGQPPGDSPATDEADPASLPPGAP